MERINLFQKDESDEDKSKSSSSSSDSEDASPQTVRNKHTIKVVKDKIVTNAQIFKEDLQMSREGTTTRSLNEILLHRYTRYYKNKRAMKRENEKLISTCDNRESKENNKSNLSPLCESKSVSTKDLLQSRTKKSMYFSRTKFSFFQKNNASRHKSMKLLPALDDSQNSKNIENYVIEQSK